MSDVTQKLSRVKYVTLTHTPVMCSPLVKQNSHTGTNVTELRFKVDTMSKRDGAFVKDNAAISNNSTVGFVLPVSLIYQQCLFLIV